FVYDAIYLLRTFILILVDHQLVSAPGSLPVDAANIISCGVLLYFFKLVAVAYPAQAFDSVKIADACKCQQLIFFHLNDAWKNRNLMWLCQQHSSCHKADSGCGDGIQYSEVIPP